MARKTIRPETRERSLLEKMRDASNPPSAGQSNLNLMRRAVLNNNATMRSVDRSNPSNVRGGAGRQPAGGSGGNSPITTKTGSTLTGMLRSAIGRSRG